MQARLLLLVLLLALFSGLSGCNWQGTESAANEPSHSHHASAVVHDQTDTAPGNRRAPLFNNLGNHHHPISTRSKLAQRYFDQGFILTYGFNHAEAARSFQEAAKLDPNCAMCFWGVALVLGPNINAAMDAEVVPEAWEALQQAIALSEHANAKEKAYIQALAKRYSAKPVADRKPLDAAYANAMRAIAKQYPDDLDAATLFAEALMDKSPWSYWTKEGQPKPETSELLAILDSVLTKNPHHPGANHLYIHAVEAGHPELGIAAADRLRNLVPGSGHLVHMPSHIYIRVGRYHDAAIANEQAIAADASYATQCHAQGLYPLGYMPHNYHFLAASATMEGRSQVAIASARQVATMADTQKMREPGFGTLQHFYVMPLYALTRFGRWEEVLQEPAPAEDLQYPTGVWHYARGISLTAKGDLSAAQQELSQLQAIATDPALETVTVWDINTTSNLLQIASKVLAGELAAKQGKYEQAIKHLQAAADLEAQLNYDEPETWPNPVRHSLGAVLLKANRPAAAEKVYWEDLRQHPENGWSLFGLVQSLQAQSNTAAAKAAQKRFEQAWQYADITLIASRF